VGHYCTGGEPPSVHAFTDFYSQEIPESDPGFMRFPQGLHNDRRRYAGPSTTRINVLSHMAIIKRTTFAVLLAGIAVASCSSPANDAAAWCTSFKDGAIAGAAFDAASDGSPEQSAAAAELEAAFQAIAEANVPKGVEADFNKLKLGPDPLDGGDSFHATAERVGEWAIANCDYPPEVVELLKSDAP
jgi:hypothetical protein